MGNFLLKPSSRIWRHEDMIFPASVIWKLWVVANICFVYYGKKESVGHILIHYFFSFFFFESHFPFEISFFSFDVSLLAFLWEMLISWHSSILVSKRKKV